MLKERRRAAQDVASAFLDAEAAVDQAAERAAACTATMLKSRGDANLPVGTGMEALALVSEGTAALVRARQLFIKAHGMLATLPDDIGLRTLGYGDVHECPPIEPAMAMEDQLRRAGNDF